MKNLLAISGILLLASGAFAQVGSTRFSLPSKGGTNWTASLKTEVSSNLEQAQNIGGAATDTQLRMAYKFTDRLSVGFLIGAKYKVANETERQSQQEVIGSNAALVTNYTAEALLGADKTTIDGRLYLPTSNTAQQEKQNFQVRADILLPYTFGNEKSFSLGTSPRLTDYELSPSKFELHSQARLTLGKTVAPYIALNHKIRILDTSVGFTRTEEVAGPEAGIEFNPHSLVKLTAVVSQERNILDPGKKNAHPKFSVFDTAETKYLLTAQIKL